MSPSNGQKEFRGRILTYRPELDGLRALSLLLVFTAHLGAASFDFGFLGVDVFFVLSGFLITELLLRAKKDLRSFYLRRFTRLFPALFVMVLITSLLSFTGAWVFPWWVPLVALGYGMNLVGFFTSDTIADPLTPTWSLAVEEQFYLIWPLVLFAIVPRIGRRNLAAVLVLVVAVTFVVQFYTWDLFSESALRHGPLFRPVGLLLGCAVALYGPIGARSRTFRGVGLLMGTLVTASLGLVGSNGMFVSLATTFLLLALNMADNSTKWVIKALSWSPLAALGRRSYSLYLWNLPMMMLSFHFLGENVLGIVVGLIATVGVGFTSFRFVEVPVLTYVSTRRARRQGLVVSSHTEITA